MNKHVATSIMFEEIKAQLQTIEKNLNLPQQSSFDGQNNLSEIKEAIDSIKIPEVDIQSIEKLASEMKSNLYETTQRIEKLVQSKEESRVVNHIHSIQIKSVKVCIAFSVLYILLMVSVYFNFR